MLLIVLHYFLLLILLGLPYSVSFCGRDGCLSCLLS
jgi:hypothetical protein